MVIDVPVYTTNQHLVRYAFNCTDGPINGELLQVLWLIIQCNAKNGDDLLSELLSNLELFIVVAMQHDHSQGCC